MLQRMVQAALRQQDAALGQQASLQELLVSAEMRAATAGPGSHGVDSVKLGTSHIKVGTQVSRKCSSVHMVSFICFPVHSHSMLDCQLVLSL